MEIKVNVSEESFESILKECHGNPELVSRWVQDAIRGLLKSSKRRARKEHNRQISVQHKQARQARKRIAKRKRKLLRAEQEGN